MHLVKMDHEIQLGCYTLPLLSTSTALKVNNAGILLQWSGYFESMIGPLLLDITESERAVQYKSICTKSIKLKWNSFSYSMTCKNGNTLTSLTHNCKSLCIRMKGEIHSKWFIVGAIFYPIAPST